MMADKIATACAATGIRFIYKSSFDKANRSSHNTARGVGIEKGLEILAGVKDRFGCPILTDVHAASQCAHVAKVVDVLQIPAFLCRSEEHTSELQSLMRISYAVSCFKKNTYFR